MSRCTCTTLVLLLANLRLAIGQFPWPGASADPASDIVGGLTDAFLGHSITSSERNCMSNAATQFTTSLNDAVTQALQSYKMFSGQQAAVAARIAAAPVATAPVAGAPLAGASVVAAPMSAVAPAPGAAPIAATQIVPAAAVTEGEETVVAMELAASLSNLYKLEEQLGKSCLNDDVLAELQKAGDHLTDISYVGGHLTANGVDVVNEMSDAFTSFENKNYRAFGKDVGTAWRKVLLSKREDSVFAKPSAAEIGEVTDGFFSSFFGPGFGLEVVSDSFPAGVAAPAAAAQPPQLLGAVGPAPAAAQPSLPAWAPGQPGSSTPPSSLGVQTKTVLGVSTTNLPLSGPTSLATYPPTTVDVDLHSCITKNIPLWKSAWSPVFQLVSSSATLSPSEAPEMSDLMKSMMDVQMALTRCNIDPTEEAMLIDAIATGKLQTRLNVPDEQQFHSAGFASLLSSALEDMQDRRWHAFGSQIGEAMQDLAVVGFSEKYEVDVTGRLRKKILGASELGQTNMPKPGLVLPGLFGAVSVGFLLFVTLVGLRSRQSIDAMWRRSSSSVPEFDRLHGSDLEAVVE